MFNSSVVSGATALVQCHFGGVAATVLLELTAAMAVVEPICTTVVVA